MPSDINESTWGVYYRIVFFGWAVLCCLVNCYSKFLQHLFPCLHLDPTPGAESDVQTIWLQPPKEWLGKTRIRLDHISICVQTFVRYRFFASSGLSLDCLFGMCNAVIQTAPMHSASFPSLALISWGNEMGLVGVPRFSDAVACGGQRLTRAEYPK